MNKTGGRERERRKRQTETVRKEKFDKGRAKGDKGKRERRKEIIKEKRVAERGEKKEHK